MLTLNTSSSQANKKKKKGGGGGNQQKITCILCSIKSAGKNMSSLNHIYAY